MDSGSPQPPKVGPYYSQIAIRSGLRVLEFCRAGVLSGWGYQKSSYCGLLKPTIRDLREITWSIQLKLRVCGYAYMYRIAVFGV